MHQEGLEDAPTKGTKPVRYAQRVLLGDTDAERQELFDILLNYCAGRNAYQKDDVNLPAENLKRTTERQ
ncbi:hypothetical protein SPHINGOT1_270105 [Sphingomonas sp. T1]|nr:hypothetical protein SPHINGOT1_270105 [Sphingomonas sp. T1]